ncbi:MAG: prolyl oligopeptidase family serine peptidase [Bacteroidota bacterium]
MPYADYYFTTKQDLKGNQINWKKLFNRKHYVKQFYIQGNDVIFLTALNAPNFKICKTSLPNPDFENPEILVPEDPDYVITDLEVLSDRILFVKNKNGVESSLYYLKNNKQNKIDLPVKAGYLNVINKGNNYKDFWIEIEGWTTPKTRLKYNYLTSSFESESIEKEKERGLLDYMIREVEVLAHDGKKIPLSIIHNKDLILDGNQRVLLSGYGAYGISDRPKLEKYLPFWLRYGGVYAVAHVRGGGEKGDSWYRGGFKATKENTWKDFITCSEFLIEENYTSPKNLAIFSGSAGGILIGRAITERPDLYSCAMVRVGVLNTLRHEHGPSGPNNIKEYGTVNDSIEFESLLKMDSYHHIKSGVEYPATLLMAGLKDARTAAWESGKFVARMQEYNVSDKPILLNIDPEGGHLLNSQSL